MKKKSVVKLVAIAAMTVLALAACGSPIGFYEDGESRSGLVPVTVSDGSDARALTRDLDIAAFNYIEVIFTDGTDFYRASGYKGESIRIQVPEGNYDNTSNYKAVMLVGRASDKALLGVGVLDGTTLIDFDTTTVKFLVSPVLTGSSADVVKIDGSAATRGTVTYGAASAPYYNLPATPGADVPVDYPITCANSSLVVFNNRNNAYNNAITTVGLQSTDGSAVIDLQHDVAGNADYPAVVNNSSGSTWESAVDGVRFTIKKEILAGPGWGLLSFRVPVSGLAENVPDSILWYLQGGLANNEPQTAANNAGGGIIFGVDRSSGAGVTLQ